MAVNRMMTDYLVKTGVFILVMLAILAGCILYAFYGVKSVRAQDGSITDADKKMAVAVVQNIADETLKFVLDSKNPLSEKIDLLQKNLIAKIDFKFVSPFVLGAVNRTMTDDEKTKFQELLSDLMLYSYANKFSGFDDYVAEVIDTENLSDKGQVYVNFIMYKSGNKDSTKVECKARMRKYEDGFQIVDIVVAGVSMALTYRSEFKALTDIAKTEGKNPVEVVITTLTEKIDGYKKDL
jgi:phospholipid transport system substrate-binding protein